MPPDGSHTATPPRSGVPTTLAEQIDAALPQTQCTRCGYPDCRAYANAIAFEGAAINQCPPGGQEGVRRLAALTGQVSAALNPAHGHEQPRAVAIIDETWCIGCTLCLKACPVDAIVGANKTMHTVLEDDCTGCELCIPVCPVDCIDLQPITGHRTGWAAWSPQLAQRARGRYERRLRRLGQQVGQEPAPLHQRRPPRNRPGEPTSTGPPPAPAPLTPSASPQASDKARLLADIMAKAQALRDRPPTSR